MSALGVLAATLFVVVLVGLDRFTERLLRPSPRPVERTIAETGLPQEELTVQSGPVTLAAWLLRTPQEPGGRPLLILAHGWGANRTTVLRLGEPLARAGYDLLLYDTRGHGANAPQPYVTVKNFRDDAMAVVRYASSRFPGRPLVFVGHSLGGSAGVLAAADGAPLSGLVLIAAPSDVIRVLAEYLTDHGLPGSVLMKVLRPFFWRRVGGTFRSLTPRARIGELKVPVLLLQPEHDDRVERRHAEELADAGGLELRLITGREHTDVLEAPETLASIEAFVRDCLGELP